MRLSCVFIDKCGAWWAPTTSGLRNGWANIKHAPPICTMHVVLHGCPMGEEDQD